MRFFSRAFLSGTVLAAVGLLAAPAVTAAAPPTSCPAEQWTVRLTGGPTLCASGSCVTYTYEVSGSIAPDHIAGLMPLALPDNGVTGDNPNGNQVYAAGNGDPVTQLGIGDMSRKAFKVNPNGTVFHYTVTLDGQSFALGLVPVKVKKGKTEVGCALAGPVEAEVAANPLATFTPDLEEVLGGKCKVHAHTNKQTGVTTVTLVTPDSDPNCSISDAIPIQDVTVKVGNDDMGPVLLSEGFTFLVGTGTCAYKQYYPSTGPVYRVCW